MDSAYHVWHRGYTLGVAATFLFYSRTACCSSVMRPEWKVPTVLLIVRQRFPYHAASLVTLHNMAAMLRCRGVKTLQVI